MRRFDTGFHRFRPAAAARSIGSLLLFAGAMASWAQTAGPSADETPLDLWRQAKASAGADDLGVCVETNEGAILLSRDISEPEAAKFLDGFASDSPKYNISKGRITSTATNGSTALLQPITITYSFIPDGTNIPSASFAGEPAGPSVLFAQFDASFPGGRDAWKAKFAQALNGWGAITGTSYVEVSDDGAAFPGSAGALGARGDVRIGMHSFGAVAGIAYNFFPNGSDQVLDSQDIGNFSSSSNDFRILRNVVGHEHGHGLGMDHVTSVDRNILMEPTTPLSVDGPQDDDIRGAQRQYADNNETNNTAGAATNLDTLPQPIKAVVPGVLVQNVAIEDNGLVDFYAFAGEDESTVDITVTPVGDAYSVGPVPGVEVAVNTLIVHDLGFELLAPNQTTIVTVNAGGLGVAESLAAYPLASGAGVYFIRVFSGSATNDIQRYSLSFTLTLPVPENDAQNWANYE